MGTLHECQKYIFIISHPFLLRIRNVSDKIVEKIKTHKLYVYLLYLLLKTHILSSVNFFSKIVPFMR